MGISSINRKKIIKELIGRKGTATVAEIVNILHVSEVSVRKYLEELERDNFLLRTYGGAVLKETTFSGEFFFGHKSKKNIKEKQAIAKKAFSLIEDDQTVFLDTGTTVFELSKLIKIYGKKLVVATNSLSVVSELSQNQHVKVFVLGGFLRHELMDFSGTFIKEEIKHLNFNQAFLGVDGISAKHGITTTDSVTAEVENEVMGKSLSINILADFSKIGRISLIPYGKLEDRNIAKTLITDLKADKKELAAIKNKYAIETIQIRTE
ncbi:MAG TPA: DeoR/GlpR family DNA-binding transcription regulator [bacterium]|nr:DeoR/GlpR family DNA-binding transcription regulator [bacterium]